MADTARRIPEPLYPSFPKDEYEWRYRRTREYMDAAGIDLLFLTERENVAYYSGLFNAAWISHGFLPGLILFHREQDEPLMIMPDFWLGTTEKTTWINEIILHHETHSNPDDFATLVAEVIRKRGWDKGTIGYEAGHEMILGMPIRQFDAVRSETASAKWVPGGPVIWQARMIKSQREIEKLRHSAQITNRAQAQLRAYARPGMNELEAGRFVRMAQIAEGGSYQDRLFLNMRSAGPDRFNMPDSLPQDRPMEKGEVLIVDAGIYLEDYPSDTARSMVVGEPTQAQVDIYKRVIEALDAAIAAVRPGVKASAIYNAVRKVYDEAGFPVHVDMVGHGIGLDIHEPPMLSPVNDYLIEENMVLNLEPWVTLPDQHTVFTIEDTFAVTKNGCEQLSIRNADELWYIT
jgi:Xaa-Pro aminopeptidase